MSIHWHFSQLVRSGPLCLEPIPPLGSPLIPFNSPRCPTGKTVAMDV
jgi:hypothetical protein